MNEPILGKSHPRIDHFKQFTWSAFLSLRDACQKTADSFGYPVYMVGSALYKEVPRDIDISIIIPHDEYIKLFGELPDTQDNYGAYLGNVSHLSFKHTKHIYFCIHYCLDIKICPDTWWVDKPKMLLAMPKNRKGE